ncbi:DEAD/DEAH box helicase family protein [Jatrophihabitans telluris]|uniref:DEAD/DEAH box helicase family protein n=1 Tax=Jatrophihabitans telluris TaxID=2038343 RepID=A0ABY4QUF5_9ACTN|nr:DEAD/DEAH box helicase family protein [Jatrophihabitans telluris]UQX86712.1 DEAD/DEAH box helicase family protein [Jatrophihabitans telluris]
MSQRRSSGTRLRLWQREALAKYETEPRKDFLVTATPGAGKTTFALSLAVRLFERRIIDRLVVVAPTDHLRTQWAEAAEAVGVALDPTLSNAVGPVPADLHGYVTTYAQVAGKPTLHAARATAKRTLVIFDEIHHAGDGLSWGEAVADAFDNVTRRLSLTGTPFRTNTSERIPFVRYEPDGKGGLVSTADYSYGYRDALSDHVVRPVVFAAYTGVSRWRNSAGEVIAASLTEAGTKSTEQAAWRTALDPKGDWVPHVIAAMDERLTQLRGAGMPDAAGIVLASDQDDARAYARIVEQVTGEKPYLILSDDPKASAKIGQFGEGGARIAVCVRMVSEGVDVPRAACLAWLTSYRTPLFFAQAVGRVVRARGRHESATVFLPAVRPLLALAAELEEERNHVLPPPSSSPDDLALVDELDGDEAEQASDELLEWEALDAEAQFAHVLHSGRAVTAADHRPLDDEDSDFLGLPGLLSPEQTAALLSQRDVEHRKRAVRARQQDSLFDAAAGSSAAVPGAGSDGSSALAGGGVGWRATAELRREVNRLVAVLSARSGTPHGAVHAKLRAAVPGPASASASAEVLEARREHLMRLL